MRTLLVTGFEPFGGLPRNPSQEVVAELPPALASGTRLRTLILPVEVETAPARAVSAACADGVDAVVALGLAVGSSTIRIERLFANLYEHGGQSVTLAEDAPDGLFAQLPVCLMAEHAAAVEVPVELSMSAGLYVCNALGFGLARNLPAVPSGFIHLPMTPGPGQGAAPTVTLGTAVRGVVAMLAAVDSWLDGRQASARG